MEIVRAEDEIEIGGLPEESVPQFLGKASGHTHDEIRISSLESFQPPQLTVCLLGGLLPHATGVNDDNIRTGGLIDPHIALIAQKLSHLFGIMNIHLTAKGMNVKRS
jgi:hypothetical protein